MREPSYRQTVAALALGQILSWAILYYGFTSFVLPMQQALAWSKPVLMGAFTLGLAVWGCCSYASGAAIDRGHGRALMSGGNVLGALGLLLWSQAGAPWMLYAAWALIGAAMAMCLYEPAFNVLTHRYPDRYPRAIMTLTLVAGFASTLSFPSVAALQHLLGWRHTLVVLALVLLLVVAPLYAWALRGPSHAQAAAPATHDAAGGATLRAAASTSAFWLLTLAFTLHSFTVATLWAHAMPAFAAKGLSAAQALSVLVWVGPAQVGARFLFASVGQGLSIRALGVLVLSALPLSFALFAAGHSTPVLIAFALMFGLANGLMTILRGNIIPQTFGRRHVGRIAGTISGVALIAHASAPLLTAWLLGLLAGYDQLLWLLVGCAATALGAYAVTLRSSPRHSEVTA
jgi:MFS family permease